MIQIAVVVEEHQMIFSFIANSNPKCVPLMATEVKLLEQ